MQGDDEMKILSNADIARLLPMAQAIEVVETAMKTTSAGGATLPLRTAIPVGGQNLMGIMPGSMSDPACFGVKLVSLFPRNPAQGQSSHRGAMILFEPETGGAISVMDASLLTAVRTAAASGVATRALARPDARTLTILGNGEQAEHHLDAMLSVRDISEVRITGRDQAHLDVFAQKMSKRHAGLTISTGTDIQGAVHDADIICTTTAASDPILKGDWIAKGCHLNVIGSSVPTKREVDDDTVLRSSVWVDYLPSALAQAGELVDMIKAGQITEDHILGEIGAHLNGAVRGRANADEITLYRSLGIAAQDLSAALYVTEQAQAQNIGQNADF
jgi:alanine dehydrogenase